MTDFYTYIEDYCEGRLNDSDQSSMEIAMKADEQLAAAVSQYPAGKKLAKGLLEMDVMETLASLKAEQQVVEPEPIHSIKNPNKISPPNKKSPLLKWLALVALIGLLAIIANKMINDKKESQNKEEILIAYHKPMDPDATKSVDTLGMDLFQKGKYFFNLNDFEQSELYLKNYIKNTQNQKALSQAYYWLGAAHLEQWEVEAARVAWGKSQEDGVSENMGLLE